MNEDLEAKKYEIEKSYLTKEEFIIILNNIEFLGVKDCDLELVTGFIVDIEKKEIKPLCKNIEIN